MPFAQPSWDWVDALACGVIVVHGERANVCFASRRVRDILGFSLISETPLVAGLLRAGPEVAEGARRALGDAGVQGAQGGAVHVRGLRVGPEVGRGGSESADGGATDGGGRRATHLDLSAAWTSDGQAIVVTLVDATARAEAEGEAARLRASLAEMERTSQRLRTLQAELADAGAGEGGGGGGQEMVGASAALRRVREQVARVAPSDLTVLIHGETGSGKELVARSIHAGSPRAGQAFVAVNCAALPESLIESELFGHEKGAFTGADRRRLGKFELADGGTLFLDEVAELPMQAQAKLLRVIQEHAFERVGGAETVRVDTRILAATHRDLARQVERGRFREDLFYRLNVFRIEVPALRERREDLRALVEHLHARMARRMGRPVQRLSEGSLRRVMAYGWPGNVRELSNAVERATLLADGPELEIELPESPLRGEDEGGASGRGGARAGGGGGAAPTRDILLDLTLEQLQRLQITHALESCGYRVFGAGGAAERLDVNPNTLLSRMDKYGIPRPRLMKRGRGERGSGAAG